MYLAKSGNEVLAGAVYLDFSPTSVYLIAFLEPRGKSYHLGTAIIDRWFRDSLEQGFTYLDFDHMRDIGDPSSYQGYTDFKSEFAEYEIAHENVWWKWMS